MEKSHPADSHTLLFCMSVKSTGSNWINRKKRNFLPKNTDVTAVSVLSLPFLKASYRNLVAQLKIVLQCNPSYMSFRGRNQ